MKKTICLLLTLLLTVSLFTACAQQPGENTQPGETTQPEIKNVLKVGFGRADITPTQSVPLGGYGNTLDRMSTEVMDPLYATCVALSDANDNTVLLYHVDLGSCHSDTFSLIRAKISRETGIPVTQILVGATHMHSGPDLTKGDKVPYINDYKEELRNNMLQAAKDALADRKEAKMYANTVYTEGLTFIRHYIMADGTYTGWEKVAKGKDLKAHTSEVDNAMQLIKFVREGGEDVLLVNWQTHPHRNGGSQKTYMTSDIVGVMRSEVESKLGCKFAYFTGASGDVNPRSLIMEENITKDYLEQGMAMAKYAMDAQDGFKELAIGEIKATQGKYTAAFKDGSGSSDITVYAFSMGDFGVVTAPYEMFCSSGEAIKEASPFKTTFVVTCANMTYGYIPAAHAFAYIGYETDSTKFVQGTAEGLVDTFNNMLKELSTK